MKKIAVALLCLFILSGCVKSRVAETVETNETGTVTSQDIICVRGNLIWIGGLFGNGVTSQIVGSCDLNE